MRLARARLPVARPRRRSRCSSTCPPRAPGRSPRRAQLDLTARTIEAQVTPSGMDLSPARPYLPVRGRVAGKASGDLPGQGDARAASRSPRAARPRSPIWPWPTATGRWSPRRGSRPPASTTRGRRPWWSRARGCRSRGRRSSAPPTASFPITRAAHAGAAPPRGARREPAAGGARRPAGARQPEPEARRPRAPRRGRGRRDRDRGRRGEPDRGASSSRARVSRSRTSAGPRARRRR